MSTRQVRDPDARHYRQGDAVLTTFRDLVQGLRHLHQVLPGRDPRARRKDDRIEVTDISRCIFCGICAVRCPDFVFVLDRDRREAPCSS